MARPKRQAIGGYCYHVLSRGNNRQQVFHKEADFAAFLQLFDEAHKRVMMRVIGYCIMPNHFHLVLWPINDGDLSRWMQWVLTTHVQRYHRHFSNCGHVWQGRFKAFPIQDDDHLLSVLRYVERNPLRAGLVASAADWKWNSLMELSRRPAAEWFSEGPVQRGKTWNAYVDQAQTEMELAAIRFSVNQGTPLGDETWTNETISKLGLTASLHRRGRPRKF